MGTNLLKLKTLHISQWLYIKEVEKIQDKVHKWKSPSFELQKDSLYIICDGLTSLNLNLGYIVIQVAFICWKEHNKSFKECNMICLKLKM